LKLLKNHKKSGKLTWGMKARGKLNEKKGNSPGAGFRKRKSKYLTQRTTLRNPPTPPQ